MSHCGFHRATSKNLFLGAPTAGRSLGALWRPFVDQIVQRSSLALPDLTAKWAGSLSVIYAANTHSHGQSLCEGRWVCPPPAATEALAWYGDGYHLAACALLCLTSVQRPHSTAQLSLAQEFPVSLQKGKTLCFLADFYYGSVWLGVMWLHSLQRLLQWLQRGQGWYRNSRTTNSLKGYLNKCTLST